MSDALTGVPQWEQNVAPSSISSPHLSQYGILHNLLLIRPRKHLIQVFFIQVYSQYPVCSPYLEHRALYDAGLLELAEDPSNSTRSWDSFDIEICLTCLLDFNSMEKACSILVLSVSLTFTHYRDGDLNKISSRRILKFIHR